MPRINDLSTLKPFAFAVTLCLVCLASFPTEAQQLGDRLFIYGSGGIDEAALPRGPLAASGALTEAPVGMAFGPFDRLYALRRKEFEAPFTGYRVALVEDDGQLTDLVELDLVSEEEARDLAFGPDFRLYILVAGQSLGSPPDTYHRILVLDAETLETISTTFLPPSDIRFIFFSSMAPSPKGFWLLSEDQLLEYDIANGDFDEYGLELPSLGIPSAMDADSTGALWILTEPGFVDPPTFFLRRFDPATGALASAKFQSSGGGPGPLAILRQCSSDTNVRCLQGGRFAASVNWRDFDGGSGPGRVVPGGSTDSALFWFFDAANWELLVKVLDGCDNNGNFWVFAGATTDVGFDLTVTDLESGEVFTFDNPLGNPPLTVNSTAAFVGACP